MVKRVPTHQLNREGYMSDEDTSNDSLSNEEVEGSSKIITRKYFIIFLFIGSPFLSHTITTMIEDLNLKCLL